MVISGGEGVSSGEEDGGRETFVIGESVGYLMNYAARAIARSHAERLASYGAHLGQWSVLMFLWSRDGQTQTELSRGVVIENSTMVRTLDRMERDGLVRRVRSDKDRRRINIFLTDKGWDLQDVLIPCAIATNEEAAKDFTEEEEAQLKGLLVRMISSLESGSRRDDQEKENSEK